MLKYILNMLINYTKYYAPCTLYILCVSDVCIVEVERFLEQAREKPSQKALYLINQDSQALFVLLYTLYINRIHCDILELLTLPTFAYKMRLACSALFWSGLSVMKQAPIGKCSAAGLVPRLLRSFLFTTPPSTYYYKLTAI